MAPRWILFAVASLVLIGALMIAWESLRAGGARLSRRAMSSALLYFVNQGLIAPLLAAGFVAIDQAIDPMGLSTTWSVTQIVMALLFFESITYALHRLAHHVPLLYRFHRVHHQGKDLHWLDAFRQHPVEFALFQGLGNLPAVILFGAAGHVSLWINVALRLVTAWLHARGPVSLGPLEYVLTSPSMHHAHHERRARTNYGGVLSIFDWMGGTARRAIT
jgi:sterol desaturase/sphingolipid hydroxylase (fatty acid hydroxylase superfamily)